MAVITLRYDGRNSTARKTLETILNEGLFTIEKKETDACHYDPEFVEKIRRSENSVGKKIETADLWK